MVQHGHIKTKMEISPAKTSLFSRSFREVFYELTLGFMILLDSAKFSFSKVQKCNPY